MKANNDYQSKNAPAIYRGVKKKVGRKIKVKFSPEGVEHTSYLLSIGSTPIRAALLLCLNPCVARTVIHSLLPSGD